MSKAELKVTERTGLIRGGKVGTAGDSRFVTNSANSNVSRARQRLALPQTPELRVQLEVPSESFSAPTKQHK